MAKELSLFHDLWEFVTVTAFMTVITPICGARGGRTLTMSPSTDFKSVASADSAIAPTP